MSRTVEFKFDIGAKVYMPFGEGIVRMAALDDNRQVAYCVLAKEGGQWFKEDELTLRVD